MAYIDLPFGEINGEGSDFTIGSFTGLPSIPWNADLTLVELTFTTRRNSGATGSSGETRVVVCGSTITVVRGMSRNTDYSGRFDLTGYVQNNSGTLTYKDGSTSISIRGYHDYNLLFGASYWKITNGNIRVTYNVPTYVITVSSNNTNCGSVSGGGTYERWNSATLIANPNNGYHVDYWIKNGVKISGSENKTSLSISSISNNDTYQAVFVGNAYSV